MKDIKVKINYSSQWGRTISGNRRGERGRRSYSITPSLPIV
ncbi:hypothetical protein [Brevibacillus porteri]